MDDPRIELQTTEEEARQQSATLRQRARRLRARGFVALADDVEAHAVGLHQTADAVAKLLEAMPPPVA